jgi:hypothetical protein
MSVETSDHTVCPHCDRVIWRDSCECDGSEMSIGEFERLLARAWLAEQRKKVKEALVRALGGRGLTNRNVRHGL